MNSAELKLDLFLKIDRLDNTDLEKIYNPEYSGSVFLILIHQIKQV